MVSPVLILGGDFLRRIEKMMVEAAQIKDALRDTVFLIMTDVTEYTTEIHLKTKYGVEVIKETHESRLDAEKYILEMKKQFRMDPEQVSIVDDFGVVFDG